MDDTRSKDTESTISIKAGGEAGQAIGPYHLLQKIGEGGMGEVWVAEQQAPIRRKVALKLIKAGMDTKQVIARFESERQALAMMDHPAIARIIDAGETPQGRPFFVMEYVQGIPIIAYCDQNRLTVQERLELFMQVCDGVQHAHQKAIIHRDLKPSNILVAIQGSTAVPKIIDFGVAKATAQSLTEKTMFTELGVMIGTPEYMSPEQAEMSGQNIDTRTDIYSLGVILYELLTGARPFESKELRRAALDEILRKIREEDPPKPSTKLGSMGEASTASARKRRIELPSLVRQIRGDLDLITLKALEKDRTRRYGTPSEIKVDIERFLSHQPIVARAPSASYRLKKFVRRHRVGVGAASLLAVVLIAFAITMAIQSRRIAGERDRANQEAETARQVSDFLVGLFKVSDPGEARGNSITAREILDKGADRVNRELKGQPLVQGKLMHTIGMVYRSLGLFDRAQDLLEQSLTVRTRTLGPYHTDVGNTLNVLGNIASDKGDLAKAKDLYLRAMAIQEKSLGPDTQEVAACLHNLGLLSWLEADYPEARRLLEQALAIRKKVLGPEHELVATNMEALGAIAFREGDGKKAREIWEQTLAIREKLLGQDHPLIAYSLNNIALTHLYGGDPKGAVPLLERAIQIQEKVLGPKHPDLSAALSNLGDAARKAGDLAKAKTCYERAVVIMDAANPSNPELGRYLANLAGVLLEEKDVNGARKLYDRSLQLREKAFGPSHPDVGQSLGGLADCAAASGSVKDAEELYEKGLAMIRKPDGSFYPVAASVLRGYASFLRSAHKDARAAEIEAALANMENP
jgi:serine/threonine protein kinase/Tfp pilus assembly protein PilF